MKQRDEKNDVQGLRQGASFLERLGWITIILCLVDWLTGIEWLGPELRIFLSSMAATLLVLGIVVRKRAEKISRKSSVEF